MTPPAKKKRPNTRRFSPENRALLKKICREGVERGTPTDEVLMIARKNGITKLDGSPVNLVHVQKFGRQAKRSGADNLVAPLTSRCPRAIAGILTDSSLEDKQKVKMCLAYYDLEAAK